MVSFGSFFVEIIETEQIITDLTNNIKMASLQPDTTKFDGFCGIATTWKVLGLHSDFSLGSRVILSDLKNHKFRGVKLLKGYKVMGISLPCRMDFESYILLCHKKTRISYQEVRNGFVEAVDKAFEEMRTSQSYILLKSAACCNSFASRVARRCLVCKNNGKCIKIYPDDLEEFGHRVMNSLMSRMRKEDDSSKLYVCLTKYGQNAMLHTALSHLESILDQFDEAVVHVALDYLSPRHRLHFWKFSEVKEWTSRPDRDIQCYFPAFLCQLGNFVVNYNRLDEDIYDEGESQIMFLKAYSSLFKELHTSDPPPFGKPTMCTILSNTEREMQVRPELIYEWIKSIELYVERASLQKRNVARLEAIISIATPNQYLIENLEDLINEKLQITENMVEVISFEIVKKHLDKTLIPILNTVKLIMDRFVEQRRISDSYIPSIKTVNLACVCECLLSWGIYGWAAFRTGEDSFPRNLVQVLGLSRSKLFKNEDSGSVFLHLESLQNISLHESTTGNPDTIRYHGPITIFESYLHELLIILGPDDYRQMCGACRNLTKGKRITEAREILASTFWALILHEAFRALCPEKKYSSPSLDDICSKLKYMQVSPCTALELVEWMANEENMLQLPSFFKKFLGNMSNILDAGAQSQWKLQTAQIIETELYKSTLHFLFQRRGYRCFVVLPLHTSARLDTSTEEMREKITLAYQKVFERYSGRTLNPSSTVLCRVGQIAWDSIVSMEQMFVAISSDLDMELL